MYALILCGSFIVLRSYVFDEPLLETVIDKDRDIIGLTVKEGFRKKETCWVWGEGVVVQQVTILPENPDGIKVVEICPAARHCHQDLETGSLPYHQPRI